MIKEILILLGSIAVFLSGLKLISDEACALANDKVKSAIRAVAESRCGAVLAGSLATALAQSSIATNMIIVGFVEGGVMSFLQGSAAIMGTNIGTTMTAQLISFSNGGAFDLTAIASGLAFLGVLLKLSKNEKTRSIGGCFCGFGFVFIGLKLMTESVESFEKYVWFKNLFLVENPLLSFFNGLLITAIIQSSSLATGMTVVLGTLGLLPFEKATFLILGSNIGSCLPVVIASAGKSAEAKKVALFNVIFNALGAALFFIPLVLLGDKINELQPFCGREIGRKIANFHTFFNLIICILSMPFLKQVCALTERCYNFLYGKLPKKSKKFSKPKKNAKTSRVKNSRL